MTGVPHSPQGSGDGYAFSLLNRVEKLEAANADLSRALNVETAEVERLRAANLTLLEGQDRLVKLMGADIARLDHQVDQLKDRVERLLAVLRAARPYVEHCAEGDDNDLALDVLTDIEVQLEVRP